MGRITDIIARARDTLADPAGDRFTDERLLRLINDAQQDIAMQARILRSKAVIPVLLGQAEYTLPDDTYIVTRCLYNNRVLPFKSHMEMDRLAKTTGGQSTSPRIYRSDLVSVREPWETHEGAQVQAIVYDKLDRKKIRVYPIPNGKGGDEYTFKNEGTISTTVPQSVVDAYNTLVAAGVTVDPNELGTVAIDSEASGVVTGLEDYIFNSPYGVLTDIKADEIKIEQLTSLYGIVTSVVETPGDLTVYYVRLPKQVTTVEDDLELDSAWDKAIRYYVVAMALRDDKDTQNRQFAAEELQLYERELKLAREVSQLDSTDAGQYEVPYFIGV